jgi:ABC-2 type transport system ATP-binding protein
MTSMVEVENLSKRFEAVAVVDAVSFSVSRGEVLGFLGPNGAGKSTTMRMITGYLTPDSGRVRIDGCDVVASPVEAKRRIGYLPEGAPLYAAMTPAALLRFVAGVRGLRGAQASRRIGEAVSRVDIGSVLEQPIETLSKGFKRRVGLAQAIVHEPEVLVLDEPTDGLDPNQKHEVRALIRDMAKDKVVILSTHILEEVDAVCTRAVVIAAGRIVVDETPQELRARSDSYHAVTLRVRGTDSEALHAALAGVAGVARVEPVPAPRETVACMAYPEPGRTIAADLIDAVRARQWTIEDVVVDAGRLDEVFRRITAPKSGITTGAGAR